MINKLLGKFKYGPVVFWSFAAKGSALILFYSFQIYLARTAGIAEYGQWNVFYSIFSILAIIANCGINYSSQKHIAQYDGTARLSPVFGSALALRIGVSAVFMVLWFVLSGAIARMAGRPDMEPFIAACAPLVFFTGSTEFFKEIFIGLGLVRNNFIINTLEYGIKLAFTVLVLKLASGLLPLVWAFSLALFITSAVSLLLARVRIAPGWRPEAAHVRAIAVYALPLLVYEISNAVLSEVDTVVLGYLRGNYDVGIYSMAKQLLIKAPHLSVAISMGIMPVFARLDSVNRHELKGLFHSLLKLNSAIAGVLAVFVLIFADVIMSTLFGAAGASAVIVLRIMCGYMVFSLFAVYSIYFLQYTGQAARLALNMCVAIAADIVLLFVLVPAIGAAGAAIAVSVSYGIFVALNFAAIRKALS